MPEIGKVVHIKGDLHAAFAEDQAAHNAWRLWEVLRAAGIAQGTPRAYGGVPGHEVAITMTEVLRATFPALWSLKLDELDGLTTTTKDYLKASGNARCTNRTRGAVRWWVRDVWSDQPVAVMHGGRRGLEPTRRERQLSPSEAGEDRMPGPVTVTKNMPPADLRMNFQDAAQVARQREAAVLEVLTTMGSPLSTTEIISLAGLDENARASINAAIKRLIKARKVRSLTHVQAERPRLRAGAQYYALVARRATQKATRRPKADPPAPKPVETPSLPATTPPDASAILQAVIDQATAPLQGEVAKLKAEVAELKAENTKLRSLVVKPRE